MGPPEGDWPRPISTHVPSSFWPRQVLAPSSFGPRSFLDPPALWSHKLWVRHVLLPAIYAGVGRSARTQPHPWAGTGARSCKSRKGRRQARPTVADRGPCPNGATSGPNQQLTSCFLRSAAHSLRAAGVILVPEARRRARKKQTPRAQGGRSQFPGPLRLQPQCTRQLLGWGNSTPASSARAARRAMNCTSAVRPERAAR